MRIPAALLFFLGQVPALSESPSLEGILAKMDQKGETLRSMSARISQKKWTEILQEFDAGESGRFYFLKEKGSLYLRKEITHPQENVLVIGQGTVLFYQPRIRQAQRYQLGKHGDKAEFLLLGFGSDRAALKQAYHIRLLQQETLDGRLTYVLELAPRSSQVSAYFSKIMLWVDSQWWVPIQQKLVEPSQDYLLIRFEDIRLNDKISRSRFELKLPPGVKVIGQ